MRKTLRVLAILSIIFICGCSRTFTIVKNDSPANRQNIKILNYSCRTGSSALYLKNSEVLMVENLTFANDTLTFFLKFPEEIRKLPVNEVRKIVTRDGPGSLLQGIGFGAASGVLGLIMAGIISPIREHGIGLPDAYAIYPGIGIIAGFTAGEIIGVDKTFIFKD